MKMFSLINPQLRRLLSYRRQGQEDNDSYDGKLIKYLVKKFHLNERQLSELEEILNMQSSDSVCITVSRSISDGRIPKEERNELLHMAYCRLWRWPDLCYVQELRPVEGCHHSFYLKRDQICINPYHYDRLKSPALPAIMVPKLAAVEIPEDPKQSMNDDLFSVIPENTGVELNSPDFASTPLSFLSDDVEMDLVTNGSGPCSPLADVSAAPVAYKEPPYWCSIAYHELGDRVGDTFHVQPRTVTIDGFVDPSSGSRMCLGLLSNVNRDQHVEQTRRHIGRGIKLSYMGGEVYVECLSECHIWVQSPNCNKRYGWHPATVCKVPAKCNLKIFSNREFAHTLSQSVHQGFEAVYQLTRMCTIRISFAKGWGAEYRRQTVTSCHCWVEIHLTGPLQWLDGVLSQLQGPDGICSSVS